MLLMMLMVVHVGRNWEMRGMKDKDLEGLWREGGGGESPA